MQTLLDLLDGSAFLAIGIDIWNVFTSWAYSMLSSNLSSLADGNLKAAADGVQTLFAIIGSAIMSVLFLAEFIKSSSDLKHGMTLESIVISLLKLCCAEAVILNMGMIISRLLHIEHYLLNVVLPDGEMDLAIEIDSTDWELDIGTLAMFFIGLLLVILTIACGCLMLYTIYSAFLKIYFYTAVAPLALSTLAGPHGAQHTAWAWFKTFICAICEIAGMALMMRFCAIIASSGGLFPGYTGGAAMSEKLLQTLQIVLTIIMETFGIKSVDSMIRRGFGF